MINTTCIYEDCGIEFGIPDSYHRARLADHRDFYCPNGHAQHFTGEPDGMKYKRLWEGEQATAASLRREREMLKYRVRSLKGVITRQKR